MSDFTTWPDLLAERLGGAALLANDEFFAPKENLVKASEPEFLPHAYTERGKLMDGWESRRKRGPGFDWCIVRLGVPGVLRGVVVDTSYFRGNFPESCSIDGCSAPAHTPPGELASDASRWVEVLPRTKLEGHSKNAFAVASPSSFTHLRLNIHPDGGVARLRVHGEPVADWPRVARAGGEVDLAALEHGGRVLATSDAFFGSAHALLFPGRGTHMGDGWETRRRRGPGHDWAIVALGLGGNARRVEVDTTHFKGNYPDTCSIEACSATSASELERASWFELLPRQKLLAHTVHAYERELAAHDEITHVRLNIHPDGGVSRLRVFGVPGKLGRERAALRWLDTRVPSELESALLPCLGSTRWARAVAAARPIASLDALHAALERTASELGRDDWLEAFARHPRIGERERGAHAKWSEKEQAGARGASSDTLAALAEANRAYDAKFGHIFIVCATGKKADEMLELCRARLANSADDELRIAAGEQRKIARLRVEKLLAGA
jgi:allantoicase